MSSARPATDDGPAPAEGPHLGDRRLERARARGRRGWSLRHRRKTFGPHRCASPLRCDRLDPDRPVRDRPPSSGSARITASNRGSTVRVPPIGQMAEQAVLAEPVVVPAEVVGDRIEADALDRHAAGAGAPDLGGDHAQPGRAGVALGAGLGDQDRAAGAGVELEEQVGERAVERVVGADRRAAVDPLVGRVVVGADDVEEAGLPADLRPEPPGDQVGGLELGVVPALGLPARAAGGGVVVDGDQRLAVDEAGARVDVAERVHRGDGGAGELDLELEAAAAGEGVEVGGVAAGPGEEGDLVDRAPEGDGVGRLAVVRGRRRGRRRRSGRRRPGTRCRGRRASRSGGGPR